MSAQIQYLRSLPMNMKKPVLKMEHRRIPKLIRINDPIIGVQQNRASNSEEKRVLF